MKSNPYYSETDGEDVTSAIEAIRATTGKH